SNGIMLCWCVVVNFQKLTASQYSPKAHERARRTGRKSPRFIWTDGIVLSFSVSMVPLGSKGRFFYTRTERSRYWRKPPLEWVDIILPRPPSASYRALA